MKNIVTFGLCEGFIENLTEFIDQNYIRAGKDLSRMAIVFPGKRPALFLKRAIAERTGKGFLPPAFFTIDEFMGYATAKSGPFLSSRAWDQSYQLYHLARTVAPSILEGREAFSSFLPWTREILSFIDQLDLEDVPNDDLRHIEDNARIGYAVPQDINQLLQSIVVLRAAYHKQMLEQTSYSRGFQYLQAARGIDRATFPEFDRILFCNFFYLHRTEETVMKTLCDKNQATLFLQGDQRRWPVLGRIAKKFSVPVREGDEPARPSFDLRLYSAFDGHSQVCQVREILRSIKDWDKTVVVLPYPGHMIPLLSEITADVKDINVSMGYPLKRSPLYSLLELVFNAQLSRGQDGYYTRDYLKLLRHPLVKNLRSSAGPAVTRILVHKIEEMLTGQEKTDVSGMIFIRPDELEQKGTVFEATCQTLRGMGLEVPREELASLCRDIHDSCFYMWEGIEKFFGFASALEKFVEFFLSRGFLDKSLLNLKIAGRICEIIKDMRMVSFREEMFPFEDIYRIFDSQMENEMVAFKGSPLKGLQVLGLFETRALNFDNVVIMDVNEGVLPHLSIYEPLIPREVMISLNLDRLEYQEEIQRYQFMRLIAPAKTVHLVYQEGRDKEKSRFIEELIWEKQKESGRLDAVDIARPAFAVKVAAPRKEVRKTPEMIRFLKDFRYSASSVNTYLRDPLEFYYRYVLGLKEKEDLLEEPENRQVGTFVHELLQETFGRFVGRKPVIDKKFRTYFQGILDQRFAESLGRSMKADAFLLKSVLDVRLQRFLDNEAENPQRDVRKILFIEKRFEETIALPVGDIRFAYQLDRVDRMADGSITVTDYKTGSVDPMPKGIEQIESMALSREMIRKTVRSFQIPLYFMYLDKYFSGQAINAVFYNLRTLEISKFIDSKMNFDRGRIRKAFLRALDFIMAEILDPDIGFGEDEAK